MSVATSEYLDPFAGEGTAVEKVSNMNSVFLTDTSGVSCRIEVGHAVIQTHGQTRNEAAEKALVALSRNEKQELY